MTAYRDTSDSDEPTVYGTVVEFTAAAVDSVQQGTVEIAFVNTSGTASISSVDTSRAALFYLGQTNTSSTTGSNALHGRIALSSATQIRADRDTASSAVVTMGYCVVEFASGVLDSLQTRSVTFNSNNTSETDSISSVDRSRSMLLNQGVSCINSTMTVFMYAMELTAADTVSFSRQVTSTSSRTINYQVLEFDADYVSAVQRGRLAVDSATSADATISSVDTSKTLVNHVGFSTDGSNTRERYAAAALQSATAVRGYRGIAAGTSSTVGWEAVSFT